MTHMNDAHVKISPRPITELERESITALTDQIDQFRQALSDLTSRANIPVSIDVRDPEGALISKIRVRDDAHFDVGLAEVDRRTESLHRHRQLKAAMLERDPELFTQEGESVSRSRGRHARVRIDRFQQTSVLIERLSDLNQQLFQTIQTLEKLVNLLLREFHDSSSSVGVTSNPQPTEEETPACGKCGAVK